MGCCKDEKKCCGIGYKSIPAALGDDTGEFKPENGAYHNMLIRYEANGALYFYTNDGIFTQLDGERFFTYINELFNNIDLQSEVDQKLNEMAEDGTLSQILSTYSFYVSPTSFDAVGDDTADDTQALQDCIDYAHTNGLSVYLPTKTYLVTDSLKIYSNTVIIGNNGCIHTEANKPIITADSVVNNVCIRGLKLRGSNEAGHSDNYGIKLVCYYSTFDSIYFVQCYGAIFLDTTGASGTLVENKITNCEVRNCQRGFYLGANNNNKLTDGIFENNIVYTNNASLDAITVGSSAGWIFNNVHVYGTSRYGFNSLNGYNTNYSNIYVESTSDIAMRINSIQTVVNLTNIQILIKTVNGIGINSSSAGYTPYGNPYLNLSNISIKADSSAEGATGINCPNANINNYSYYSAATTFTPYNVSSNLTIIKSPKVEKQSISDSKYRLSYGSNMLGLSDTDRLDVGANTEHTIRFKVPDNLGSYNMRRFDLSIQGYQYWNGTHNFDYKSEITLISKNSVKSIKNATSSSTTNFATAPAVSFDSSTNELVITFTPSIALTGCYRITG